MNSVLLSSQYMNWCTPRDFFEKLNAEFHFTLDAAATDATALCPDYFTPETDGLARSWATSGAVWCNPPYGREIGKWVKKAHTEALRGGGHCFAYPGQDGHQLLPRLHIPSGGDQVYTRAAALHGRDRHPARHGPIPVHACGLQPADKMILGRCASFFLFLGRCTCHNTVL